MLSWDRLLLASHNGGKWREGNMTAKFVRVELQAGSLMKSEKAPVGQI